VIENKQPFPGFVGPSYQGRSQRFDDQRCVNFYLEVDEAAGATTAQGTPALGKNQQTMVLIGTPCLSYLQTIGSGPIRATYTVSNLNLTLVVSGNEVFQIAGPNGFPEPLTGNLSTTSGPVAIADNGIQAIFVDGSYGYTYTIGATTGIITAVSTIVPGTGYATGTFYGVALQGGTGTLAYAEITVAGGGVTAVNITQGGSGYVDGDVLTALASFDGVGLGTGFSCAVSAVANAPILNQINDPNFYPASTVTFQDGYFILNQTGTTNFFISDLYSVDWLPLNQSAKTGNSDILEGVISVNRQLYLLGARTLEIWWNAGASGSSPFQRQDGRFSQQGLAAPASLAVLSENFYWLSSNAQGGGVVMGLANAMPVRISTHAVEHSIQAAGASIAQAVGYAYQQEGHYFYVLNVPGLNTTWVYDMATNLWHERQSTISGNVGRHLGETHAFLGGTHIIGDYNSGNIYSYDLDGYTDNGQVIQRIRQTPHVAHNSNNMFYNLMDIDFQFGVGLVDNGTNTANNVNPTVVVQVSRDGGETFGNPIYGTLGQIGAYRTRARFARLGYGRDAVFKVTVTDAVEVQMLSCMMDLEEGTL
jgi:hypothetical protein